MSWVARQTAQSRERRRLLFGDDGAAPTPSGSEQLEHEHRPYHTNSIATRLDELARERDQLQRQVEAQNELLLRQSEELARVRSEAIQQSEEAARARSEAIQDGEAARARSEASDSPRHSATHSTSWQGKAKRADQRRRALHRPAASALQARPSEEDGMADAAEEIQRRLSRQDSMKDAIEVIQRGTRAWQRARTGGRHSRKKRAHSRSKCTSDAIFTCIGPVHRMD